MPQANSPVTLKDLQLYNEQLQAQLAQMQARIEVLSNVYARSEVHNYADADDVRLLKDKIQEWTDAHDDVGITDTADNDLSFNNHDINFHMPLFDNFTSTSHSTQNNAGINWFDANEQIAAVLKPVYWDSSKAGMMLKYRRGSLENDLFIGCSDTKRYLFSNADSFAFGNYDDPDNCFFRMWGRITSNDLFTTNLDVSGSASLRGGLSVSEGFSASGSTYVPTQPITDSSTAIATTKFVHDVVDGLPVAADYTQDAVWQSLSTGPGSSYKVWKTDENGVPGWRSDANTTYTLAGLMGSSAKGSATQPVYWNGSAWTNTTYTLGKSVPSDAKFTDTTYSSLKNPNAVTFNNGGSGAASGTTYDGSAAKTISYNTIGAAASSHTHNYAGSSSAGGAATSANKLNTNKGSATQPVYFSGGVPVACTYALNKTVPSNAVFTDTNTWPSYYITDFYRTNDDHWTVIKYSNGYVELFGRYSHTFSSMSATGSLYYTEFRSAAWPFAISQIYSIEISSYGHPLIVLGNGGPSTTKPPGALLERPTSSTNQTVYINYHAIGYI